MKGQYTIQLINKQGEVVQEVTDNNMMTNAISNLLNPSPFLFAESTAADYENYMFNIVSNIEKLLGGVILWSENIPEDPNMILPPNIEAQVGYAGNDAYTGSNPFRGSYNALESGKTENGYKFVFDFPTSAANGIIKCVTLTSADGGKCGWGGDATADIDRNVGFPIKITDAGGVGHWSCGALMGQWRDGMFTFGRVTGANGNKQLKLTDVPFEINSKKASGAGIYSSKITRNYNECDGTLVDFSSALAYVQGWQSDKDKIVVCFTGSYPYDNFIYTKLDPITKTIVRNETIKIAGYSFSSISPSYTEKRFHELDGFLYVIEHSTKKIIKINLADTSQFEEILFPPLKEKNIFKMFEFTGHLAFSSAYSANTQWFYLSSQGKWITFKKREPADYLRLNIPTLDVKQPFLIIPEARSDQFQTLQLVQSAIYNAYLATINNLSTPIVKTNDVTMKIVCNMTDI